MVDQRPGSGRVSNWRGLEAPLKETTRLRENAERLFGVHLSSSQVEAFAWYSAELISWNRKLNLTAVDDPAGIEYRHFLDSLSCLLAMGPNPGGRLIDVGSGAGFPGIPLKIACPRLKLTLVESIGKKAGFCRHVVDGLRLRPVEVESARSEELAHQDGHRQQYDWAVARAVAGLPTLVEYLLPFLKVGGVAIAQKGESAMAEAHSAESALRLLGGRLRQIVPVEVPTVAETRYLVVVEKTSATPEKYPRRAGIPAKRPLK
jgi:16S rRNA (guanine527-N7)-methyltransferase